MIHQTLNVDGMTCNHCVETVHNALKEISGVQKVSVDLERKKVSVDYDELQVPLEIIRNKINEVGFDVLNQS